MKFYLSDNVLLFLKNNSFYNKAIKTNLIEGVRLSFNYFVFHLVMKSAS